MNGKFLTIKGAFCFIFFTANSWTMLFYVWFSLSCIHDFNILASIQCSIISTIVQVTLRTFYPLFEHWYIDHKQMRNFAKPAKNAWNVFVRNSSSSNYRVDGNANLSSTINKQSSVLNFNPLESLKKRGHWKQRNKCGICSFEKWNSFLNCTSLNNSSRFLAISTALDLRTWTVKVVSDKSEMQLQPTI